MKDEIKGTSWWHEHSDIILSVKRGKYGSAGIEFIETIENLYAAPYQQSDTTVQKGVKE